MSYPLTIHGPMPAADWVSQDPLLAQFEIGQELDGGLYGGAKMGPGHWNSLSYWNPAGGPKRYVANLTQSGVAAPVATVFVNTLGGTIVWTYGDVGAYLGTLTGAFPANKTFIQVDGYLISGNQVSVYREDDDTVEMDVTKYNDTLFQGTDGLFAHPVSLTIEVYP